MNVLIVPGPWDRLVRDDLGSYDVNRRDVLALIALHGSLLNLPDVSFDSLQRYLEEARFVPDRLRDVLLLLLRKWKRSVKTEKWESTLIAFCYTYSQVDAWELEKFGFPRCRVTTKLRILKNLLELQFDCNSKFKEKINERSAQDLRFLPVGRDKNGLTYWFLLDNELNVVVYREEHDDVEAETWQRIVSSRDELARLIEQLETGESGTDKSGSATPAVTGSGASSDTEGTVSDCVV
ncbi:Remodeling and spacing factor 1 [Lamellibrachia satsuma]|nr:Remodeling and spacing factor 1 [Lamellibrachia satsuma]